MTKTIVLLSTLLLAAPALAQEPAPSPTATAAPAAADNVSTGALKLKVGGEMFLLWSDNLTQGQHDYNSFDVSRAYLNLFPTFDDRLDGRVTTDITRAAVTGTSTTVNTTGSLVARLKYGYLTYHATPEVDATVGLQQTPWITYEEDIWPYRGLGPTALEQFWGDSSSDFGFTSKAKLLDKRLELHGGVYNGEFYAHPETNKYKNAAMRASFQILPGEAKTGGLKVHAFYEYGLKAQNADRVRSVGMVSWEMPLLTVAGQVIYGQDGNGKPNGHTHGEGETVFGFVNLPWQGPDGLSLRVLARVDVADPNVKVGGDASTRLIAGVGMLRGKYAQAVLDYQQIDPQLKGAVTQKAAYVHFIVRY